MISSNCDIYSSCDKIGKETTCLGGIAMRYGKWIAIVLAAAFLFQPSQIMAAKNRCTCEDNGGTCKCEKTAEQILEEWENRCRCSLPDDLDYNAGKSISDASIAAVQEQNERFVEILRDGFFIYYMDKKTARYKNIPHVSKEKMIDVWIKLEPLEYAEGDYTYPSKFYLEHYLLRPKRQQIQFLAELEITGRPSNEVKNLSYDARRWESLIPGSIEDSIYHAVMRHKSDIHDESTSDGTSIRDYIEDTLNISL